MDADRDAHGDWYRFIDSAVKPGDGYVTNASDCDDGDPSIHDGRVGDDSGEDSNCDGIGTFPPVEGPAVCLPGTDWDCDGVNGTKFGGTDCDDQDARVFPGNAETRYDGRDNDCDFQSADTGYDRPYQPDRFVALHIDPSHGPIQG